MAGEYEILKYEPNVPGNVITGLLYAILGSLLSYHIIRHKTNWALCLPIGAFASSLGFFLRLAMDPKDVSLPLYVAQNILIIVSPCAFLAFNYMLYGRFVTVIDPQFGSNKPHARMEKSRYSFMPPRIVGRTFVLSDVATFLIQVAAGSIVGNAGGDMSLANIGNKLFLVGVCAQGISYCIFTVLLSDTLIRLVAEGRRTGMNQPGRSWLGLDRNIAITLGGLYFSSLFIIIRSIYRVIEFVQDDEYLLNHEVFMFILDAVPLILAIGVWAILWPTVLLDRIAATVQGEAQMYPLGTDNAQLRLPNTSSAALNQQYA